MRWRFRGYWYKYKNKQEWHQWFAWHPVIVRHHDDGTVRMAWLEKLWRKGHNSNIPGDDLILGVPGDDMIFEYEELGDEGLAGGE